MPARMTLGRPLTALDRELVEAARDALRGGFLRGRQGVGAAVRTRRGRIYVGLNFEGIHTPCAEPVALGAALTAHDTEIESMVSVRVAGRRFPVLSPCGNCRQMLLDYAPNATVIVRFPSGRVARITAQESLPGAFRTFGR
ncbi:MAG TPA: cytidine deaminase [Thermoplasmata archaeon]|nr:cytidine deaminase [Thermoplasmata archaeon]